MDVKDVREVNRRVHTWVGIWLVGVNSVLHVLAIYLPILLESTPWEQRPFGTYD